MAGTGEQDSRTVSQFQDNNMIQQQELIHDVESILDIDSTLEGESHETIESHSEINCVPKSQVPNSILEHSHRFCSRSLDVCEEIPYTYAIMGANQVQFQSGFEWVNGKESAHLVFDKMLLRKYRLQQRRKPSLSPKSWMFKYKEMKLLRLLPQNEHYNLMGEMLIKQFLEMSQVCSGFDQMLMGRRRGKQQNLRRKLSKSWRFKFKKPEQCALTNEKLLFETETSAVAAIPHEESQLQPKHNWKYELLEPVLSLDSTVIIFCDEIGKDCVNRECFSSMVHDSFACEKQRDMEEKKQFQVAKIEKVRFGRKMKNGCGLNVVGVLHWFDRTIWLPDSWWSKIYKDSCFKYKPGMQRKWSL
ncbi:unnamed protein product [Arabis nemorensis]|uniref:Uncharacterized protein n=1 Tax=Arabis nemorensis TaxID=586526 RepID=A0A565C2G7_9BRAS|nr:unnamed protein product [Arabis nemorensis]